MLVYVGLDDVFARMAAAAEGDDAEVYELFADNLGSVASVYGSRGDYTRVTTVVTLFPE
jgi:energy-converting hydrogenase A subunit M